MSLSYSSSFQFFSAFGGVYMGTVECKGTTNESPGSLGQCSSICTSSFGGTTNYNVGAYSTRTFLNNALSFTFEPISAKDGVNLYYGDQVSVSSNYSTMGGMPYFITYDSGGSQNCPVPLSSTVNANYQTFEIAAPPGSSTPTGSPVYNSSSLAFKMVSSGEANNTYLYYDTGNSNDTDGWVWLYSASSSEALQTTWSISSIANQGCLRPDPQDQNMFHAEDTQYGDSNYGEIKKTCHNTIQGPPSTPDGMEVFQVDGKDAVCGVGLCTGEFSGACDIFGDKTNLFTGAGCGAMQPCGCGTWSACPTTHWTYINKWEEQTQTPQNQIMCCSGLWSSSDQCHPYYCPKNTSDFNVNSSDGGSCPDVMMNACTSANWSEAYFDPTSSDAYIGNACDAYIAVGDGASAESVAKNAVNDFYIESGGVPTDDHPFVRRSIDLCSQFPGMCDDILTQVCSTYTNDDLDPSNYAGRTYDPEGTNLLDTCGCFLNNDQYLCYDKDGNYDPDCKGGTGSIGRTCNTMCNFPNSVKPYDESTGGIQQCGGTTCVITGVTFDSINSTSGSFSITQACNASGNPPYICYLGSDIDISKNGGSMGNVQIQQNCEKCFIYDVDDPSKAPIPISCNVATPPTPGPTPYVQDVGVIGFLKTNILWVTVIVVMIVIALVSWVLA